MSRIFSGRLILYLLFLLVADFCFAPAFHLGLIRPILLYLLIFYSAVCWGWEKTLPLAVAAGLLRDFSGSQSFGVETVAAVLGAFCLDFSLQKIDRESFVIRLGTAFLFVFLMTGLVLVMSAFLGARTPSFGLGFALCLGTGIYSAALMPFFFQLTARWFRDRGSLKQYELFS